jgi:integrase
VIGKTVHCSKAFVWALNSCFRLMVLLDVTTGLRRSELFALKWRDVDFSRLELNVVRSAYLRIVGNCNTDASRKPSTGRSFGRRPLAVEGSD